MGATDSGREPVQIVEIDQAICVNTFGVAPCTAALSTGIPNKCFNTRKTCADADNFDLAVLPLTLRFCKAEEVVPRSWQAIPCLEKVTTTPCKLNPGGASRNSGPLGARATVTITMRDLPSADFKVDPYQDERFSGAAQFSGIGYSPLDRGTFWTKWLRRNPYFPNWIVRIRDGYIEDDPATMVTRTYFIEDINGPDNKGKVTIKAQDILGLADNDKATCPVVSQGILANDILSTAVVIPLLNWVVGEYPTSGTVRIDDECITYNGTAVVGLELRLTVVAHGTDGTTAADHSADSPVQLCYRVADADNVYCWEVVEELLTTYANIPAAYIPSADWAVEGAAWLPIFTVHTLITEPTGVNQLVGELCEQCLFNIWWDERAVEIKMRALRSPSEAAIELNDRQHIIKDSWSIKSDSKQRASQVWVWYAPKDATKSITDTKNYSQLHILTSPGLEAEEIYGSAAIKVIYSRWIESGVQCIQLITRYLSRFRDGVRYLKIRMDAKDGAIWNGEVVAFTLHSMVDAVGEPEQLRWQVISAEDVIPGEVVEYDLQNYLVAAARYGYYDLAVAPHDGEWADDDGLVDDGLGGRIEGYSYE